MSYEVIITREGDSWLADVPSVPGAHTFAKSLPSLFESVREVIVLMDDLDDDATPNVHYVYDVEDELVAEADVVRRARAELEAAHTRVQANTAEIIGQLTTAGYSVRDAAALVGVTPGRVSQIAPSRGNVTVSRSTGKFVTMNPSGTSKTASRNGHRKAKTTSK